MQKGVVLDLRVEISNKVTGHKSTAQPTMEPRETEDPEDQDGDAEQQHSRPARKRWYTARTILGVFAIMLSLALLGIGIKMSVKYDEAPLIHVSFAFLGFTVSASP